MFSSIGFALRVCLACVGFLVFLRVSSPAAVPNFDSAVTNGFVNTYDVWEASGLAASRQNPGVLWTHNDSGYRGSVMAISTNGAYLARHYVPNIFSGDFEDIAIGPGPQPQMQYIYLGDIGDNFASRASIRVLRFPEPSVYHFQSNAPQVSAIVGAEEITLSYPDGPFNCEGMMVDPVTGDLFLATKQTNVSRIYRASRDELNLGQPITLSFVREITSIRSISSADISADGSLILMRRASRAYMWSRSANQTVGTALGGSVTEVPYVGQANGEPNGEAIAFEANGLGYYTLSEGYLQPVVFFKRTSSVPTPARVFIPPGSNWRVLDSGGPPPSDWRTATNDTWWSGVAPLGYGGRERTAVSYGDADYKNATTYFRRVFSSTSTLQSNLAMRLTFNDGIAVYLNGSEVFRRHLPADATYGDFATTSSADVASTWMSYPLAPSFLRAGTNVLAVEVHQANPEGTSLNFDLQLVEARVTPPAKTSGIRRLGTNQVLTISGTTGFVAIVEQSLDGKLWSPSFSVPLTRSNVAVTNPILPSTRFFRVAP